MLPGAASREIPSMGYFAPKTLRLHLLWHCSPRALRRADTQGTSKACCFFGQAVVDVWSTKQCVGKHLEPCTRAVTFGNTLCPLDRPGKRYSVPRPVEGTYRARPAISPTLHPASIPPPHPASDRRIQPNKYHHPSGPQVRRRPTEGPDTFSHPFKNPPAYQTVFVSTSAHLGHCSLYTFSVLALLLSSRRPRVFSLSYRAPRPWTP
ncbi:hypothetical protein VTK26DRAFT_3715 [Humicola hyalothermophila]